MLKSQIPAKLTQCPKIYIYIYIYIYTHTQLDIHIDSLESFTLKLQKLILYIQNLGTK